MRVAVRSARVVAPPVDAMVLLGDVGERQEVRERASDGQRRRYGHLSAATDRYASSSRRRARFLGGFAHPLDVLEQFITPVMPQHTAEDFS